MSRFVRAWLAAVVLFSAGCAEPDPALVILVSLDTTRADAIGVFGAVLPDGSSPTPVIDALAREGTAFPEAFTPVPLTLPAHTSMMSGLYPDRHGIRDNDSFRVPPEAKRGYPLIAETLRKAGWDTGAFVSAEPLERRRGLDAGFRVYDQPDRATARGGGQGFRERDARTTTARAIEWLRAPSAASRFLFVHYFDPHRPYERHPGGPAVAPGDRGAYLGEVAYCDAALGTLLAALPDGGRSAWVVVTADHGEGLGDRGEATHGFFLHDSTLRVPLIVRPPAGRPRPPVQPARLVDIAPTILAIAGLPPIPSDGTSLLDPPAAEWFDRAESLYGWHQFRYARLRASRSLEGKLIEEGAASSLVDWRRSPLSGPDVTLENRALADALRARLLAALLAPGRRSADELTQGSDAFGAYIGGRTVGSAIEPGESENATLPTVTSRLSTIEDLEEARAALRAGDGPKALRILGARADERSGNPALLFWTARAAREAAAASGLGPDEIRACLAQADTLFAELGERWGDPRGEESRLLVARDRHRLLGDRAALGELVRRANGIVASGRGTALVYALRAFAYAESGDLSQAESDLERALAADPEDPRIIEDLRSVRARKTPPPPSPR